MTESVQELGLVPTRRTRNKVKDAKSRRAGKSWGSLSVPSVPRLLKDRTEDVRSRGYCQM